MKSNKGFNLLSTIIIIIITAIASGITTGVIMYNSYKQSTGLSYNDLSKDTALLEFLEVHSSITDDYYEDVDKTAMLEKAMSAMMDYLSESYTTFMSKEETDMLENKLAGEYRGIGIYFENRVITEVFKNSPAQAAGLLKNDEIIAIDGEDVHEYSGSRIQAIIKNSKKDKVSLTILRNGEELKFDVNMSTLDRPAISKDIIERENKKIGYIYIETFSNTLAKQISAVLTDFKENNIDSLIIDVRDNTGGYLNSASDVASLFLKKDEIIYSLEDKKNKAIYKDKTEEHENMEIVVLINKNSASASEILAAALHESYGAILVGEKSFGKGKIQQTLSLEDGSMVKYTSAKWMTPNGICIDGVGIEPQYNVENVYEYEDEEKTILKKVTDNQLPKAIEILTK